MTTESAISVFELEQLLAKDLKCEFTHQEPDNCTKSATHRVSDCNKVRLVCAYGAELIYQMLEHPKRHCMHCKKPALDCWRIRSI